MKKTAFPSKEININGNISNQEFGISQRLYIATQIACAKIASGINNIETTDEIRVQGCYRYADELIRQDENT